MIKYARSRDPGLDDLQKDLGELKQSEPGIPEYEVLIPRFKAYRNQLLVRFEGSARPWGIAARGGGR